MIKREEGIEFRKKIYSQISTDMWISTTQIATKAKLDYRSAGNVMRKLAREGILSKALFPYTFRDYLGRTRKIKVPFYKWKTEEVRDKTIKNLDNYAHNKAYVKSKEWESTILDLLKKEGPLSAAEVSRKMDALSSSVFRVLNRLNKKGIVSKAPSNVEIDMKSCVDGKRCKYKRVVDLWRIEEQQ